MAELTITEECIGCEACEEACPEVFAMDEATGRARVTAPESAAPCTEEAISICPVQAIVRE